jgi:succinoglycan biosynthesis transport protein ExoP
VSDLDLPSSIALQRRQEADEGEDDFRAAWTAITRGWAAFRRRWPVAVAITVLGCLAAGARLQSRPEQFSTEGLVQVGMYADVSTDPGSPGSRLSGKAASTHLRLLTSDKVVELALQSLGREVPSGPNRRAVIKGFLGLVKITPIKGTFLVRVQASGAQPKEIAARVNALMDAFIPFSNDFFGSRYVILNRQLSERETSVRESLRKAEEALQELYRESGRINFEDRRKTLHTSQSELQAKFTGLQIQRASVGAERERLNQALDTKKSNEEAIELLIGRLRGEGAMTSLRELHTVRARFKRLATSLREGHPEYQAARLNLEAEEVVLRAGLTESARAQLAALDQHLSLLVTQQDKMGSLLGENKKSLQELDRREGLYSSVSREVKWFDRELEAIRQQLRRTEGRAQVETAAQIVNRADVPQNPLPRFPVSMILLAFFGSLGLGVGVVLIWDRIEDTVSDEEAARSLGLPILGRVPHATLRQGEELALLRGEVKSASSFAAEAFRVLRTNLTFAAAGLRNSAVVVTSGSVADGKSLTCAQLGVALAKAGGRTLLIEGDMRRPRLQTIFQSPHPRGLSNLLTGELDLQDAVQATDFENLFLLPAGPAPPNPADLIVQGHFDVLLERVTAEFDHVIIDSPPAVGLADTSLMARHAKGVVFVLKMNHSRRRATAAAVEQIEATGARSLGLILNGVSRSDGYGYGYYGSYSHYYRSADDPQVSSDSGLPPGKLSAAAATTNSKEPAG